MSDTPTAVEGTLPTPAALRARAAELENRVPPALAGPRSDDDQMFLEKAAALRAQADHQERKANITAAAADGAEKLRECIERAVAFIATRLEDSYTEYEARLHRSLGWAYGYAEACLDHGDLEGAAKHLLWMRHQAAVWGKHSGYFTAIR